MLQYYLFPLYNLNKYTDTCFLRNSINNGLRKKSLGGNLTALGRLILTQSKQKHWEIKIRILFYLKEMEGSREYLFKARLGFIYSLKKKMLKDTISLSDEF